MALIDGAARRVRRGSTLLLPYVPDPAQVLETVRLFHPAAEQRGDTIRTVDGIALRGPVVITPGAARRAGIPPGWPVAYVSRGDSEVVPGLAHRLGGRWFHDGRPVRGRDTDHHQATVYLTERPDPDSLSALLAPYAAPLTESSQELKEVEGVTVRYGIAHSRVRDTGIDLYVGPRIAGLVRPAEERPYALGGLRSNPELLTCDLAETKVEAQAPDELAMDVAQASLAIVEAYKGVALDVDGYRITRPEDLLPR
jgi:hypothetical protein